MFTKYKYFIIVLVFSLSACGNTEDPKPFSITFELATATKSGTTITPKPAYQLTLNFDANGQPTTYTSTSNGIQRPNLALEGNWTLSGGSIRFESGNDVSEVAINTQIISSTTTGFTLSWTFDKSDVELAFIGDYVFEMSQINYLLISL